MLNTVDSLTQGLHMVILVTLSSREIGVQRVACFEFCMFAFSTKQQVIGNWDFESHFEMVLKYGDFFLWTQTSKRIDI